MRPDKENTKKITYSGLIEALKESAGVKWRSAYTELLEDFIEELAGLNSDELEQKIQEQLKSQSTKGEADHLRPLWGNLRAENGYLGPKKENISSEEKDFLNIARLACYFLSKELAQKDLLKLEDQIQKSKSECATQVSNLRKLENKKEAYGTILTFMEDMQKRLKDIEQHSGEDDVEAEPATRGLSNR